MRFFIVAVPLGIAVAVGARHIFRRIATHQSAFPHLAGRSNTQVHRINQNR